MMSNDNKTMPEKVTTDSGSSASPAPVTAAASTQERQPGTNGPEGNAGPPPAASVESHEQPPGRHRFNLAKVVPFLILLLAAGILFRVTTSWNSWVGAQTVQRTNDAYLRADVTPLSTRASGTVVKVAVEDFQRVKAGELLVQIKSNDYRAQVGQAEAGVRGAQAALENNQKQKELQNSKIAGARSGVDAARAEMQQAEAGIRAARADLTNAQSGTDAARAAVSSAQSNVVGLKADVEGARSNVEGSKADVEAARSNIETLKANVEAAQSNIEGAKADAERARLERDRQEYLVSVGATTHQKLEQVVADDERLHAQLASRQSELLQVKAQLASRQAELLKATSVLASRQAALLQVNAQLASGRSALRQAQALLAGRQSDVAKARAQLALRQAALQQAHAQLSGQAAALQAEERQRPVLDAQRAQLVAALNASQESLKVAQTNLDYTSILAPTDGQVSERKVRVGQLVSPGTQAISLIGGALWIQANYEETQLRNVRNGDAAKATVDAFPGVVLTGHVEEIAPASGSQFALLPPDNATGNYTKIVQRIPVKIALDPDPAIAARLRPGMSVVAEITTSGKRKS
jgi:membrane fusion protein (multidrug efflux system)